MSTRVRCRIPICRGSRKRHWFSYVDPCRRPWPMTDLVVSDLHQVQEAVRDATADQKRLEVRAALEQSATSGGSHPMTRSSTSVRWQELSIISRRSWSFTLRAGTPMNVVETALADARQMLAFEPPSMTAFSARPSRASAADRRHHRRESVGPTAADGWCGPRLPSWV